MKSIGATPREKAKGTLKPTFREEAKGILKAASGSALGGAIFGYLYARKNDLPKSQAVKAYAIYHIVRYAFDTLVDRTTKNKTIRYFAQITVGTIIPLVGIQELTKRGLMHDKLKYVWIAGIVMRIFVQTICLLFPDKVRSFIKFLMDSPYTPEFYKVIFKPQLEQIEQHL